MNTPVLEKYSDLLTQPWLWLGRVIWLLLVSIALLLFFIGLPIFVDELHAHYGANFGLALQLNSSGEIILIPGVGEQAAQVGLMERDVLMAVDGEPLTAAADPDLEALIPAGAAGTAVTLQVRTGDRSPREITLIRGGRDGQTLARYGIPASAVVAFAVGIELLVMLGFVGVAAYIFWKRGRERIVWLSSLTLVLVFASAGSLTTQTLYFAELEWQYWLDAWFSLIFGLLLLFLLLFPGGRFSIRWLFGIGLVWLIWAGSAWVWPDLYFWRLEPVIYVTILSVWFGAGIVAQVWRYRFVSDERQRQQTKWVVWGIVVASLAIVIQFAAGDFLQSSALLFDLLINPFTRLVQLLIPITFALAIFQRRLWEIDLIFNRTLVYGALTVLITAAYILLVSGLGMLAVNQSDQIMGLMLATVIVGMGVRPLHRQIQTFINRILPPTQPVSLSTATPSDATEPEQEPQPNGQPPLAAIPAKWRLCVRLLLLAFALGAIALLIGAIPARLNQLRTICTEAVCPALILVPADFEVLQQWGISATTYAIYHTAVELILIVPVAMVWLIVFRRYAHYRIGLLVCLALVYLGVGLGNIVWAWTQELELVAFFGDIIGQIGAAALLLLLFLFPDGRIVPRWTRYFVYLLLFIIFPLGIINLIVSPGLDNNLPDTLNSLSFLFFVLLGTAVQIIRYRYYANQHQRQQTKWVVVGIVSLMSSVLLWFLLMEFFPLPPGQPRLLGNILGIALLFSLSAAFPVSLGLAILHYRLWDIDIIINRTLVYGGLTATIIAIYSLVVGGLGTVLRFQNNLGLSLLATAFIAVIFQPVRERFQRTTNRLMFGERDTPLDLLARLGAILASADSPSTILPTYAQTIAESLRLPFVSIWLRQNENQFNPIAAHGQQPDHVETLPLLYHGQHIGQLVVALRVGQNQFSRADRRLLEQIAHQTAAAVNTVRLTSDLQQSRERIVTTREEERRRLRRDLHDGLGPVLASQGLKLSAARQLLGKKPDTAEQLLSEVIAQNEQTVTEVRRLIYDLRPPTLDDLGLAAAVREACERFTGRCRYTVSATPDPLPELPAAVEVAAYRIMLEAATNVSKHAQAHSCQITIMAATDQLTLTITDDGHGLPSDRHTGVGLTSMRERAAELGGTCTVESAAGGGTMVKANLPITN